MPAPPSVTTSRAVLRERLPGYAGQALLVALVAWLAWRGWSNFLGNLRALHVASGFGFLKAEAGFEIAQALIAFAPGSSYGRAIVVAALNSVLVIVLGCVFSTLIALLIAFGRLARHPLVHGASATYVEVFRNIPLLLQIFFWYFSAMALLPGVADSLQLGPVVLNNRGLFFPRLLMTGAGAWTLAAALVAFAALFLLVRRRLRAHAMAGAGPLAVAALVLAMLCFGAPALLAADQFEVERPLAEGLNVGGGVAVLPELMALTLGLSIYNSTFLAEIFRAGIQSVPRGQSEAAATVGLSDARAALLVVLPQALRLALPPAAGQYQTLAKASSLAAAVGYPDIMQIVGGTVLSQTSQALEAMSLVIVLYVAINLAIALAVNLANRRLLRHDGL